MEESSSSKFPLRDSSSNKPPVGQKLFTSEKQIINEKVRENPTKEEEMLADDFESDGVSYVNLNCNVVSDLPHEYNQEIEIK